MNYSHLTFWSQIGTYTALMATIALAAEPAGRPVAVSDCVAFSTLAERTYFLGGSSNGRTGVFSPDRKRFVVVLKRGDIARNVNTYSVLLFDTAKATSGGAGTIVLEMSSSSNRDGVNRLQWLDTETLAFIGENPGELSQVYTFALKSRRLQRLTKSRTPVTSFDVSANGQTVVFSAEPPNTMQPGTSSASRDVSDEALFELLSGKRDPDDLAKEELFVQRGDGAPVQIYSRDWAYSDGSFQIAVSPDGRYAVLPVMVMDIPETWAGYLDRTLAFYVREKRPSSRPSRVMRYNLLDIEQRTTRPLIDAPISWNSSTAKWRRDSKSVIVTGTYLPLSDVDPQDKETRKQRLFSVATSIPERQVTLAPQLPTAEEEQPPIDVVLQEDFQHPPKLVAIDRNTKQTFELRDLNPQLSALRLAKREVFTWQTPGGDSVTAGLFYPPDYRPGKRYPLVIQTHGFNRNRFTLDGPWSSAYAAEPLAAAGIVVLQMAAWDPKAKRETVNTPKEGPFEMAAYESAVAELDRRGIVDSSRVGIAGFSRTFYTVGYTLTHSDLRFAAAVLTDGFDGGYLQYLAYPRFRHELEGIYGGPPYGAARGTWTAAAPASRFENVSAAVRVVALGPSSLLKCWEWYAGLQRAEKAVQMEYLPDAAHLVVKPSERAAVQQGMVDWFCFWLKGEMAVHDADSANRYAKWRALKR